MERRRSQRIAESVPLVVRGIDLLGHPFEERTSTLAVNLHGCRYSSRYHLPRNSWVTLETRNGSAPHNVRARVAWIHRPHSIRELFQVAVELEEPVNLWDLQAEPTGRESVALSERFLVAIPSQDAQAEFGSSFTPMEGPSIAMTSHPEFAANFDQPFRPQPHPQDQPSLETVTALWRERLGAEMVAAQAQWNELLQSSIDRTLRRLAEQLPERTQEAVRASEEKLTHQLAGLGHMLGQMSAEAQNTLVSLKAQVDQELWKVRDTLESARQQAVDRLGVEAEARVAPHAARAAELVRELSGRDEQMAESLQLHRDRMRQASETSIREVASQIEATAALLRGDFEAARAEALNKWNQEVDAMSARAGHSASEAIGRTSEWFQQETRDRLQLLVEQTLATAAASFQDETAKAASQFASQLEIHSAAHLTQLSGQLDGTAGEITGRTRTQLAEAAEAAASSFGQVLNDLSSQQTQQFHETSQSTLAQKSRELESFAQQLQTRFQSETLAALENLRQQTAWQIESAAGEIRTTIAAESAAAMAAHRAESDEQTRLWAEGLHRIAEEAAGRCNERIQTAADSWTVASVRRLNEHGQNIIESLMRSADHAVRESASKIFEGLATALKEQGPESSAAAAAASYGMAAPPPDVQPGL